MWSEIKDNSLPIVFVFMLIILLAVALLGVFGQLADPRDFAREECAKHGYPDAFFAGVYYCKKRVDGTDVIIAMEELLTDAPLPDSN